MEPKSKNAVTKQRTGPYVLSAVDMAARLEDIKRQSPSDMPPDALLGFIVRDRKARLCPSQPTFSAGVPKQHANPAWNALHCCMRQVPAASIAVHLTPLTAARVLDAESHRQCEDADAAGRTCQRAKRLRWSLPACRRWQRGRIRTTSLLRRSSASAC